MPAPACSDLWKPFIFVASSGGRRRGLNFGGRSRNRFRDDGSYQNHLFAVEIMVRRYAMPEVGDGPPRAEMLFPTLTGHLLEIVPGDIPWNRPLADESAHELHQQVFGGTARKCEQRNGADLRLGLRIVNDRNRVAPNLPHN